MTQPKLKTAQKKLAALGHKPKSGEHRNVRISIMLSPTEKAHLDRAAHTAGLRQSDWMRWKMFGAFADKPPLPPTPQLPQISRELLIELRRIGNNINQQTKAINTITTPTNPSQNLALLTELKNLLIQIQTQLYD
jgi:hypothetical protein